MLIVPVHQDSLTDNIRSNISDLRDEEVHTIDYGKKRNKTMITNINQN